MELFDSRTMTEPFYCSGNADLLNQRPLYLLAQNAELSLVTDGHASSVSCHPWKGPTHK